MGATKTAGERAGYTTERVEELLREQGLVPQRWSNGPNYIYEWHSHSYHKVLYCTRGGITFHTKEGDFDLLPGDRLDVEPGTEHAATVGDSGVECVEANR